MTSAIRQGSSWPVLVETAAGRFVVKLRGAAQGVAPLIAEIVVAELASALGLAVPERAVVVLDDAVPSGDRRDELLDLLARSRGENLGLRYLDGAVDLRSGEESRIDAEHAARIVWLDGLVVNRDRTAANPNVLLWHGQPWLIDHGAALPVHFDWAGVTEDSPRALMPELARHLLLARAGPLAEVDRQCAALLSREALGAAVAAVPRSFLSAAFPADDPERIRGAYAAFLWKRLKPPRPFCFPRPPPPAPTHRG